MKFLNTWDNFKLLKEDIQGGNTGKVSYMYGYVLSTGDNQLTKNDFLEDAKRIINKGAIQQGSKIISKVEENIKINIERLSNGKEQFKLDFTNTVKGFGWDGKFNGTVVFDNIGANDKYTYKVSAPEKLGDLPFAGCLVYDYSSVDNPSIPLNMIPSTIIKGSFTNRSFFPCKNNVSEFQAKTPIIYIVYGKISEPIPVEPITDGFIKDSPELTDDAKTKIKAIIEKNKNGTKPVLKYTIKTGASKNGEDEQLAVGKNPLRDKAFPEGTTRLNWDFFLVTKRYENVENYLKSLGVTNIEKLGVPKDVQDINNIYGKFNKNVLGDDSNRDILITPIQ